jgi:hypothetical protein
LDLAIGKIILKNGMNLGLIMNKRGVLDILIKSMYICKKFFRLALLFGHHQPCFISLLIPLPFFGSAGS